MWINIHDYPKCISYINETKGTSNQLNSDVLRTNGFKSILHRGALPPGIWSKDVQGSKEWWISDAEYTFFVLKFS